MLWRCGVGWNQAKEAGHVGKGPISKWCEAMWKEMGAEEKVVWEMKATADKARYEAEMSAYKAKAGAAQEADSEEVEITSERTRAEIVDAQNAARFDANQNPSLIDLTETSTDCFFAKHQNRNQGGKDCSDDQMEDEPMSLG
eukprot:2692765-Prymnesium_polylepis.1